MKRIGALTVGVILSAFLIASANASQAGTSDNPRQQQGLKNSKKAMQGKFERDKKVSAVRKQGQAKKHQIQRGK
jgi:hypothetical protein